MIIAIDPGKNKCGLAVLEEDGKVLGKELVSRQQIKEKTSHYILKYPGATLVIGQSANGDQIKAELSDLNIRLCFVAETNSTLEARDLYWRENPPQGLWKIIPVSLRFPPVPIDDYAAVVLGKRFLGGISL